MSPEIIQSNLGNLSHRFWLEYSFAFLRCHSDGNLSPDSDLSTDLDFQERVPAISAALPPKMACDATAAPWLGVRLASSLDSAACFWGG